MSGCAACKPTFVQHRLVASNSNPDTPHPQIELHNHADDKFLTFKMISSLSNTLGSYKFWYGADYRTDINSAATTTVWSTNGEMTLVVECDQLSATPQFTIVVKEIYVGHSDISGVGTTKLVGPVITSNTICPITSVYAELTPTSTTMTTEENPSISGEYWFVPNDLDIMLTYTFDIVAWSQGGGWDR